MRFTSAHNTVGRLSAAAALAVMLVAFPAASAREEPAPGAASAIATKSARGLSVTASCRVPVAAEWQAVFEQSIEGDTKTYASAVSAARAELERAAKGAGLAGDAVRLMSISKINESSSYRMSKSKGGSGNETLKGIQALWAVRAADRSSIERLIVSMASVPSSTIELNNITLTPTLVDPAVREAALATATDRAYKSASAMAGAVGQRVGGIIELKEESTGVDPTAVPVIGGAEVIVLNGQAFFADLATPHMTVRVEATFEVLPKQ